MECADCKATFAPSGHVEDVVSGGHCPNCGSYRTQVSPLKDEMTHGLNAMPTSTQDDMSGNPLQTGILADGGWQNRKVRDESFASVKKADYQGSTNWDMDFSLDGIEAPKAQIPDLKLPTHAFLVGPTGKVHALPDAGEGTATHEKIAHTLGDAESTLGSSTLGRLYSNGATDWYGNAGGHDAHSLQEICSKHFGRPVTVDPTHKGLQHATHPNDKEWAIRGGSALPDWLSARLSADFDGDDMDVIAPGLHTEEAQPHESGLHGGVMYPLAELGGVHVNGEPLTHDSAREISKNWSQAGSEQAAAEGQESQWHQNKGSNVILSHADPEMLNLAKRVVESGGSAPIYHHYKNKHAGHEAHVELPHGLAPTVHKALGNLDAWVHNPSEGLLRRYIDPKYLPGIHGHYSQVGGPLHVGVADPSQIGVLQQVAQHDNIEPLRQYRGLSSHQAKTHYALLPLLAPLASLVGGTVARMGAGTLARGLAGRIGLGGAAAGGGAAGAGGAAAGGAAGGAAAGGAGGSFAKGLVGSMMGNALGGAGGGGEGGAMPPADIARPIQTTGAADLPGSYTGPKDTEDPENVDPHEHNDGDNNAVFEHSMGERGSWDSNSPAMSSFAELLPHVLEHAGKEESGWNDPKLRELHELLEQEAPGYLDDGDDDELTKVLEELVGGHKHATGIPNPGHVPNPSQQFQTPLAAPENNPHGKCQFCGATYDPSQPMCAQCGNATPNAASPMGQQAPAVPQVPGIHQQLTAAMELGPHDFMYEGTPDIPPGMTMKDYQREGRPNTCPKCHGAVDSRYHMCMQCGSQLPVQASESQGPHTPEQISLVQQLLLDSGRIEEIPQVPLEPWKYARELAQVTQQEAPPQGPGPDAEPAPPPPPPMNPQGMPDPSGGMPVPGMSAPPLGMQAALSRYAADNIAGKCPKCDSHTTSVMTKDGDCRCSNCGNIWKDKSLLRMDHNSRWKISAPHHQPSPATNVLDVVDADQEQPYDPEQDQDSSHSWTDASGSPIRVGDEYRVFSAKFSIPDILRVTAVKPAALEVQEIGAYGLGYSREIQRTEFEMDGLSFEPVDDTPEGDEEEKQATYPETGPGDQSDLSTPHERVGKTARDDETADDETGFTCPACHYRGDTEGGPLPSDCPECGIANSIMWNDDPDLSSRLGRTAGAKFTPMEQRDFIDETGIARNADKLDLRGTHYEAAAAEEDDFLFGW